jgi:hypothetical protein
MWGVTAKGAIRRMGPRRLPRRPATTLLLKSAASRILSRMAFDEVVDPALRPVTPGRGQGPLRRSFENPEGTTPASEGAQAARYPAPG